MTCFLHNQLANDLYESSSAQSPACVPRLTTRQPQSAKCNYQPRSVTSASFGSLIQSPNISMHTFQKFQAFKSCIFI